MPGEAASSASWRVQYSHLAILSGRKFTQPAVGIVLSLSTQSNQPSEFAHAAAKIAERPLVAVSSDTCASHRRRLDIRRLRFCVYRRNTDDVFLQMPCGSSFVNRSGSDFPAIRDHFILEALCKKERPWIDSEAQESKFGEALVPPLRNTTGETLGRATCPASLRPRWSGILAVEANRVMKKRRYSGARGAEADIERPLRRRIFIRRSIQSFASLSLGQ